MTAMIAASAIVLPSLSQLAVAAKPSAKASSTSKQSSGSKKLSSKKVDNSGQQAAPSYQVQMEDCDLDTNGVVDVADIVMVIEDFGSKCTSGDCGTDVNRDQVVDMNDLLAVLSNYGTLEVAPSPETLLDGVRVCLQSRFSNNTAGLSDLGVGNDAWMVHGYAVSAPKNITEEEFFAISEDDIEREFNKYLLRKPDLAADYDGMVIIDIESPFHPSDLGKYINPDSSRYDPMKFESIVQAFKLRIAVVREALPACKLGIYGFPTPHSHGKPNNSELQRVFGYEMAAARGILDQIDVICPVLYQRFGPTDNHYNRIASYTTMGIETGQSLRRTDGSSLEVQPLMSFRVFNGPSAHHKELIAVSDLADQIEVIQAAGVEEFMFWNGDDELDDSATITDRFGDLLEELDYRAETVGS
jgi:hypothetical protein